jgi:tripartite-type tricarboxylate transporter receptor subunit TctC
MCVAVFAATSVPGQDYPNRPIRIVTSPAGGGNDLVARIIALELSGTLGQIVVDNRPSLVQADIVAKSKPDGYTLLIYGGSFWITPLLQSTSYDPIRDFSPITTLASSPSVLVVHPSLPVRSVRELIHLAKANPGQLNYAAASQGSVNHIWGEEFNSLAGVNIVGVPYKGSGPGLIGLVAGEVQIMFNSAPSVNSYLKSGKLRALAVTSAQPSAVLPGLPTVAAYLPGYEEVQLVGIFGPANTPDVIVSKLNREILFVIEKADVRKKFLDLGSDAAGSSPQTLTSAMKADMARLGKVIKDANIRADK